jgi:putative tryptophan/tyrosine transport system substrate-binding protein
LTGGSGLGDLLVTKQFGLLGEFVARPSSFGLLTNRTSPNLKPLIANTEAAAKSVGRELQFVAAGDEAELDQAFAELAERRVGGLVVPVSAFFQAQRAHIIALAARYHIPTIYDLREFTDAGGRISYGINEADVRRQLGIYTAKILRGSKPPDLPVFQPTKFEFAINLKTAKALGIEVPLSMQLLADEVIE